MKLQDALDTMGLFFTLSTLLFLYAYYAAPDMEADKVLLSFVLDDGSVRAGAYEPADAVQQLEAARASGRLRDFYITKPPENY